MASNRTGERADVLARLTGRAGRALGSRARASATRGSRATRYLVGFVAHASWWLFRAARAVVRRSMRAWRRSIQVRVVSTTLILSLVVVALLGAALLGKVRDGLLAAKRSTAISEASDGFNAASVQLRNVNVGPTSCEVLSQIVDTLGRSGSQAGLYDVMILPSPAQPGPSGPSCRHPRGTGGVLPVSVPDDLRQVVGDGERAHQFGLLRYDQADWPGREPMPGLVVGEKVWVDITSYEIFYLFPLTEEERNLTIVRGALALGGAILVVLLAIIAWLVTRQVVTPVRMAARIAERLAAGRLEERMRVSGEDDLARLASSFNKMATNLQRQIRQLEELSRVQRRFVSDVSHELRTPLTTVRMAADVLHEARTEFDPVVARSAELLQAQLDRFEALLTDLLEISRFDAGAAVLSAEPVDIRELVHRVVEATEPLAERHGSRLVIRESETPCVAEVDARRIDRVLRNLVVNGIEYGDGRDVLVRVAGNETAVAVSVRDYGVGLKPGEAAMVFNRFWRADPARTRTSGGTGLGLAIALEDAHLHGGWLQAWGEPGDGSQFRITLPKAVGREIDRSPIPLEPEDSRRVRGRRIPEAASGDRAEDATEVGGSRVG